MTCNLVLSLGMRLVVGESPCPRVYLQECLFRRESLSRLDRWESLTCEGINTWWLRFLTCISHNHFSSTFHTLPHYPQYFSNLTVQLIMIIDYPGWSGYWSCSPTNHRQLYILCTTSSYLREFHNSFLSTPPEHIPSLYTGAWFPCSSCFKTGTPGDAARRTLDTGTPYSTPGTSLAPQWALHPTMGRSVGWWCRSMHPKTVIASKTWAVRPASTD